MSFHFRQYVNVTIKFGLLLQNRSCWAVCLYALINYIPLCVCVSVVSSCIRVSLSVGLTCIQSDHKQGLWVPHLAVCRLLVTPLCLFWLSDICVVCLWSSICSCLSLGRGGGLVYGYGDDDLTRIEDPDDKVSGDEESGESISVSIWAVKFCKCVSHQCFCDRNSSRILFATTASVRGCSDVGWPGLVLVLQSRLKVN